MRGVTILKAEDDKTKTLNSHTLMAYSGESGDTGLVSFDGNLMRGLSHAQCSSPSTSRPTSNSTACAITPAGSFPPLPLHPSSAGSLQDRFDQGPARLPAACFLDADFLPQSPYTVNLLVGGFDTTTNKPHLYWLDYLASQASLPYAAHGYAQYYCLSILDKHHHPDIPLEKGIELMKMCRDEVSDDGCPADGFLDLTLVLAQLVKRLPIDFKGLLVKVVTAKGIQVVEL